MGRGRQKAKQAKVARRLKYQTHEPDLAALQRELSGKRDPYRKDDYGAGDYDTDNYAADDYAYEDYGNDDYSKYARDPYTEQDPYIAQDSQDPDDIFNPARRG